MTYDPNEHKPKKPYDEGNNPDLESDDDVFENLSPWGVEGEETELNLAAKLNHTSTIDNSPPPEEIEIDEEDDDSSVDDEDDIVPWDKLEEEDLDEMMDDD